MLKQLSSDFMEWSEFEDPQSICNTILTETRRLGFSEELSVGDIRKGNGDSVCLLLDFLTTTLLQSRHFRPKQPRHQTQASALEEAVVDAAAEHDDDQVEDDIEDGGPEDNDHFGHSSPTGNPTDAGILNDLQDEAADREERAILEASVDPAIWALELERVGPRLKFATRNTAAQEWRRHLEQSQKHDKTLSDAQAQTKAVLEKLMMRLQKQVSTISAKEQSLNRQFDHLGGDFRGKQAQLVAAQSKYDRLSREIAELTADFTNKSEAVEATKQQMNERNNSMTDTAPLKKINAAFAKLREEISAIELRIGVVNSTLFKSKLNQGMVLSSFPFLSFCSFSFCRLFRFHGVLIVVCSLLCLSFFFFFCVSLLFASSPQLLHPSSSTSLVPRTHSPGPPGARETRGRHDGREARSNLGPLMRRGMRREKKRGKRRGEK